ncbi:MAG: UPF0280 family protein [Thermodesulfobacteriota bacterium]
MNNTAQNMIDKRKKHPESYCEREYREVVDARGLLSSQVQVKETDLHILAPVDVAEAATHLTIQYRNQLESYLARLPAFIEALSPLAEDPTAPPMIREMIKAGLDAGVGPMAAVAGVIAEYVGRGLLARDDCGEVVVENGGDIFMKRDNDSTIAIYAGESSLSYRVGVKVSARSMPVGICTSSGTVGHSLSLGRADSVTVISQSTALADAVATRLGNEVGNSGDIGPALELAAKIPGLNGVVIVAGEELGAWGQVELVEIKSKDS